MRRVGKLFDCPCVHKSCFNAYVFFRFIKIYHRVDNPMNEYLNHFVAARNTRASVGLGELDLVIQRYRTDQFSRSFLPAAGWLWNLLP